MEELNIPEGFKEKSIKWLKHPEIVSYYGFYPVPDEWWENRAKIKKSYVYTKFGPISWENRKRIKVGDVILYDHSDYSTFSIVTKKDLEEYRKMEVDTLPIGIFLHPPGLKIVFMSFPSNLTWKGMKNLILQPEITPA